VGIGLRYEAAGDAVAQHFIGALSHDLSDGLSDCLIDRGIVAIRPLQQVG